LKIYTKRRVAPSVPIISLIDILAILLIFFIVTTTFRKNEALLNISLPSAGKMASNATPEQRITIAVTKEEEIYIQDQPVPLENLAATLVQMKQANPEVKLELKADEDLPLGILVGVWDAFNEAGIAIKDVPARILLRQGEG